MNIAVRSFKRAATLHRRMGAGVRTLTSMTSSSSQRCLSVEFEVQGRVQGVFFRACTAEHANNLGLAGWVMNTPSGSVQGIIQGAPDNVEKMKVWLEKEGSPSSRIDRCEFKNEKEVDFPEYSDFSVKRRQR